MLVKAFEKKIKYSSLIEKCLFFLVNSYIFVIKRENFSCLVEKSVLKVCLFADYSYLCIRFRAFAARLRSLTGLHETGEVVLEAVRARRQRRVADVGSDSRFTMRHSVPPTPLYYIYVCVGI